MAMGPNLCLHFGHQGYRVLTATPRLWPSGLREVEGGDPIGDRDSALDPVPEEVEAEDHVLLSFRWGHQSISWVVSFHWGHQVKLGAPKE